MSSDRERADRIMDHARAWAKDHCPRQVDYSSAASWLHSALVARIITRAEHDHVWSVYGSDVLDRGGE